MTMLDKLKKIKIEYEELQTKISQPEVINNQSEYKKFMKRLKTLETGYNLANEYEKVIAEINEAEELLKTEKDEDIITLAKEQLEDGKQKKEELEEKIKVELIPKDPNDANDCIIEIRAGAGGDEAALFAAELGRMYFRYAERSGFKRLGMDHMER
jgi:peptide chain release factor 1